MEGRREQQAGGRPRGHTLQGTEQCEVGIRATVLLTCQKRDGSYHICIHMYLLIYLFFISYFFIPRHIHVYVYINKYIYIYIYIYM